MGYLRCENCGDYYELNEGESVEDFEACQCGGKLVFTEVIEEKEDTDVVDRGSSHDSPKQSLEFDEKSPATESSLDPAPKTTFWTLSNVGLLMMVIGFIGLIFAFFFPFLFLWNVPTDNPDSFIGLFVKTIWIYMISIIVMFLGLVLFLAANLNKNKKKIASNLGDVAGKIQELPMDYHVFTNVKLPDVRLKIGQLVVGPTGIFVIESHSLPGYYLFEGDDWWKDSGNRRVKSISNPGKQAKSKTMELRRFLNSHEVNVEYVWMNPVVSLPLDNYRVDEKPRNYNLMTPDEVSEFILSKKSRIDEDLVERAVTIIKRYSR
ncbi:MAG: hypothetical protein BME94_06795 [Methanobacteriales archaeon Met13]